MYPVTPEVLDLLSKNYRQTVEITFYGLGETFTITEKDILIGGLVIDRTSVSSSKIEIGSAVSSELSLKLQNEDGRFDNVKFEGAELYVRLGVKKYDARRWEKATTQYIPLGYFTVDEPLRPLATLDISALDRMVLFDKPVDWSLFSFPMSLSDLLMYTCFNCNVSFNINDILYRPNHDYVIQKAPTDETTYRRIIQWIAELTATCAFIDWDGRLRFKWYEPTDIKITPAQRFSSDIFENDITISGIQIVDADSNIYLSGDDGYAFKIEGNSLIQGDCQNICDSIYNAIGGFTYRPYEATTKPMPYLFPMDMIEFVDKVGISHNTIVTNATFTMNGNTVIKGQGETQTFNSYATANYLTKHEQLIIDTIKKELNETLNGRVQSVLAFNELITNSLGVYSTVLEQPDGSFKFYLHDMRLLEESNTIYTATANGFAFTNSGWNNGEPVWEYGIEKNGNVILNKVNATGIEVSNPVSKYSSQITPGAFKVLFGAMQVLNINGDESKFTKVNSDQYECGAVRLLPHYENGVLTGSNLIFITDEE